MPVNWKDPKAFERLLAAMVAADGLKANYREIATYYGQGATYDSIEGRFRIIKREAKILKDEVDKGERPPAPPRGSTATSASNSFSIAINSDGEEVKVATPKKPRQTKTPNSTPRAKKSTGENKVVGGRVAKNPSPTKSGKTGKVVKGIKQEVNSSSSSIFEEAGMDVDAEGVAEGLGLDNEFHFDGGEV